MATPETPVAAPYRPSTAATLGAAGDSSVAAAHAAVTPALVAADVQGRAIANATGQIVEALATFARARRTTIIPMLQRQLVETFVDRTPEEIAKLLGKEAARERTFLRRQAQRMARDLPKALSESSLEARRANLKKLMAREQRYMGQRERAMTARAHSVIESLDIQDASPEGAFWHLGPAGNHTPGCVAMAGKFWPWAVLREVAIPPVHPGCACHLVTMQEAVAKGLMHPSQVPDTKDALARARRNMALEEAMRDLVSEEQIATLLEEHLEEAKHGHGNQKRYSKGSQHGGEFMPKVGADLARAKGALKKLLPAGAHQRGESRGRHVWLKGHSVFVPEDREFARTVAGTKFSSPPGSTNVYREGKLASVEGDDPLHPDLHAPGPADAPAQLEMPAVPAEVAAKGEAYRKRLEAEIAVRLQTPKKAPPIDTGVLGKAAHDALLASGFVVRGSEVPKKGEVRVRYINKAGHALSVQYGRKSGAVVSIRWKPDLHSGGLTPEEWAAFQAGKEPVGFSSPPGGDWKPAGPSALGGKSYKDWKPGRGSSSGYKPYVPKPPPPPVVHPAITSAPAENAGPIPNYDHVELEQKHGAKTATAPDGSKYVLKAHGGNQNRVASELLANAVYRKLGAEVGVAGVRHLNDDEPDFASIPDVELGEPLIEKKNAYQRVSSGIIIRDAAGNVTIFEPKNHFGGYEHTFPKGGVEDGLSPQQNAHKELWEETGLHARITGLVGDFQGDTSVSRYYTGVLTGGTPTPGDESEAILTVSPEQALELLNKDRDKEILAAVTALPAEKVKPARFPRAGATVLEDGDEYLGGFCTDLAVAFQRRNPNLKIKALYSGDPAAGATLEHAVAYDPKSKKAYDAYGEWPSVTAALKGWRGMGAKDVVRDEPAEAILSEDDTTPARLEKAEAFIAGHMTGEVDAFPGPVGLRPAVLTPALEGTSSASIKAPSSELGEHFMADALLANWDVIGKGDENVRWKDGVPVRADQGGALQYRPEGDRKPFGPVPTEVWSMLGPKGQGFGKIAVSDDQKREQAQAIAATLTPAAIDELVDAAPFQGDVQREQVRASLKARVEWMGRYARGEEQEPEPLSGSEAAEELAASQRDLELFPEEETALAGYFAHSGAINEHFLGGGTAYNAAEHKATVAELDGLLKDVKTSDDLTAFAGFDPSVIEGATAALIGKTLTHKGYLNLDLDSETARKKAAGVLEVLLPSDSHALYTRGVEGLEVADDQPDLIAKRGSRLRIVGHSMKGGQVHLQAVLLP